MGELAHFGESFGDEAIAAYADEGIQQIEADLQARDALFEAYVDHGVSEIEAQHQSREAHVAAEVDQAILATQYPEWLTTPSELPSISETATKPAAAAAFLLRKAFTLEQRADVIERYFDSPDAVQRHFEETRDEFDRNIAYAHLDEE